MATLLSPAVVEVWVPVSALDPLGTYLSSLTPDGGLGGLLRGAIEERDPRSALGQPFLIRGGKDWYVYLPPLSVPASSHSLARSISAAVTWVSDGVSLITSLPRDGDGVVGLASASPTIQFVQPFIRLAVKWFLACERASLVGLAQDKLLPLPPPSRP